MRARAKSSPWLLLAALVITGCSWPITLKVEPAPAGMVSSIGGWLMQDYAPPIPGAPVLGLTYVASETGGSGSLSVRPVPDGALPPAGLRPARPIDARAEPGLYLGTFLPSGQPRYLVRLGQPGAVLGEGAEAGELRGVLLPSRGAVFAARVPFVPTDLLVMFATDGTKIKEVLWTLDVRKRMPRWAERELNLLAGPKR